MEPKERNLRVYYSCSITGGRAYMERYLIHQQAILRSPGWEISDPWVFDNPPAKKLPMAVYVDDFHELSDSDAVIADISQPSCGVGAEIALAYEMRIPVLVIYAPGSNPSPFVLGLAMTKAHIISVCGEVQDESSATIIEWFLHSEKNKKEWLPKQ